MANAKGAHKMFDTKEGCNHNAFPDERPKESNTFTFEEKNNNMNSQRET